MRNNGDLWGKVFFLGFGLGILRILFYWDLRLGILRVDIWHMGITGFWEYGFGIFGLGFYGWDFGNMVSGFFGLIFGYRLGEWFHRGLGQGVL